MDKIDIERLKTDRAYWDKEAPEGATHYGLEDGANHAAWFKNVTGETADVMLAGETEWWVDSYVMGSSLITRPAPSWDGEGLPPVGVEFQFSLNGFNWEDRVMLFNDGITCLMAHKKYPANRWHYECDRPDIRCRPLKTEKERVVEAVMDIACFDQNMRSGLELAYDAGALKMPGGGE